jgi:uncharacterized SAM-binding protein YcdF (DUF218 family)
MDHRIAAIVVLGAKLHSDGRASAMLQRRMALGIELYKAGVAPCLVLSGGGGGAVSEAEIMLQIALAAEVPASALVVEARSRNTIENAVETAKLLAGRNAGSIVLVTDRLHALRARLLFRIAGLTVKAVHSSPVPAPGMLTYLGWECVKLPVSVVRALWLRIVR